MGSSYLEDSDLTLYAKWIAKTYYTVKFDSNEGSSVEQISVESGTTITKPTGPTKDSYIDTADMVCI